MPLYEVHGIEHGVGLETIVPIEALSAEEAVHKADGLGLVAARVVQPRRWDALDDPNSLPPWCSDCWTAARRGRRATLLVGALLIVCVGVAMASVSMSRVHAPSAQVVAVIAALFAMSLKAAILLARIGR